MIQPLVTDSVVGRFLEKKGEGIHHMTYKVKDVDKSLEQLAMSGVGLIDKKFRQVRDNERVGFLHPKSTNGVLIELIQEE